MIEDLLPNIPRAYTALAEWGACLVYVLLAHRRLSRAGIGIFAAALPALLGIQFLAEFLSDRSTILWTPGMLLAAGGMYALIYLTADVDWPTATYLTARAFVLAELVASFQWQIRSYLAAAAHPPTPSLDALLLIVIFGLGMVGAWSLERHHFPRDRPLRVDHRHALSATAIAAVTFFMSNLSFVTINSPFSSSSGQEIFYIRTLVDVAGYVALYAQQGQRMELERAVEVEAMNNLVRSQHEQYLQSRRNMDVVNAKYHDLKHYIQAIRAEPDADRREGYLDQLEESVQGHDQHVDSGNPVLDAVLTQRAQRCAAEGVTLTCVVDGGAVDFVDAMSLSALVGNALDNAIEAAARIKDPDRRLVRVAIYRQDDLAMMRVENYFEGHLNFADDLPVTSKRDRLSHGFGMRNMRQVAEQYAGSLTVEAESNWFVVRVLLPTPSD